MEIQIKGTASAWDRAEAESPAFRAFCERHETDGMSDAWADDDGGELIMEYSLQLRKLSNSERYALKSAQKHLSVQCNGRKLY